MKKSHFFGDWWFLCDFWCHFWRFFGWDWGTPAILRQNPNKITVLYGYIFGFKRLGLGQTPPPPPPRDKIPTLTLMENWTSLRPYNLGFDKQKTNQINLCVRDALQKSWARVGFSPHHEIAQKTLFGERSLSDEKHWLEICQCPNFKLLLWKEQLFSWTEGNRCTS